MSRVATAVLFFVLAAGCGDSKPKEVPPTENPRTVTVRLLGVHAPGSVLVQVASVAAVIDGRAAAVVMGTSQVDLGTVDQAWAIATLDLPEGAQEVALEVEFAPDGSLERNGVPEPLDLRGAPISWQSTAALLLERNKVVVEVDVERSLAARDGQPAFFLPSFILRY